MNLIAGAATRDLSPTTPVQLAGYPHVRRISTGIHDPLLASVLYLNNGQASVVLCALDLLMLNSHVVRRIRRRVAEVLDLPEAGVLISCTHTHSAPITLRYLPFDGDVAMPDADPAYLALVEERILEAAEDAKRHAAPAELAWTSALAPEVGGNRHAADGITDPEVGVLAVRVAGQLRAVTLMYGMHPTVLHEDSTLVSSDFPYFARQQLKEKFGPEVVVLYHNGAAGDQSPRYHVTGQTFAEAERLGRKLGAAIRLESCEFTNRVELAGRLQAVNFPRRKLPTVVEAEKVLATSRAESARMQGGAPAPARTAEVAVFGAEALVKLAQFQARGEIDGWLEVLRPFEVQVLRIGEVCVAALPGEIFAEYGLELKRRARRKTFVVTYANGELQGYIVTPGAQGYEAASSLFPPQAGQILIETALEMIQ